MKKILVCMLVLCMIASLVGCGNQSKSFELDNVQKIVVYSISGKKVEVTDTETIQQITDNISSIQFNRDKSSKNMNGFGPIIEWFDTNDNLLLAISVMGEQEIDYDGYYWTTNNGSIDTTLMNELLNAL